MDFSGFEKLSLLDYDKHIASSLFVAGCDFRCPWCHNSSLVMDPASAPTIPWEEILAFFKKRKGMIEGVCITGGEPTLMPDLMEKINDLKSLGYLVKLDTNGSRPKVLKEALESGLIDYVAMDIKNAPSRYARTVGLALLDIAPIKESASLLLAGGVDFEFRTTIVEEFHDEEAMKEIAGWIKGAPRYFLQRYIDGPNCIRSGFHMVEKEKASAWLALFSESVGSASLRGYD